MRISRRPEWGPDGAQIDVLELAGDFDTMSAPEFDDRVHRLVDDHRTRLVVDLRRVGLLTSAGLTSLIRTQKRLVPLGGEETVSGARRIVLTTIKTAGLDRLVRVFPAVLDALRYFRDPGSAPVADLRDVPLDESRLGRVPVEFGLPGDSTAALGRILATYEDGLLIQYPTEPARATIAESELTTGRGLWVRFRQPFLDPDREFEMEAQVVLAHAADDGSAKYRIRFTRIREEDRELLASFAETQDAVRPYGR